MIAATQSNHPLATVGDRNFLEEACNRIRTANMRVTKPRVALVEALFKQEGPVSIERLHQVVGIKSCDLVTIYRCLAAFESLGLVRRSYLTTAPASMSSRAGTIGGITSFAKSVAVRTP